MTGPGSSRRRRQAVAGRGSRGSSEGVQRDISVINHHGRRSGERVGLEEQRAAKDDDKSRPQTYTQQRAGCAQPLCTAGCSLINKDMFMCVRFERK